MSLLLDLRRILHPADACDGRHHERLARQNASPHFAARREFERRFRCARASDRIVFGRGPTVSGEYDWFGLPFRDLGHVWIHGATGSGKSFAALSLILSLLRRRRARIFLFDFKPEIADLVLLAVQALVASGESWLLDQVQLIDPFGPTPLPLRVTVPEPGVPRSVQALALASSLEETVASELGVRMLRTFVWLVSLAIECGYPLTALARWLRTPGVFQELALRSTDPELREYAASSFGREQRASLEAIAARLDLLVFLPQLRAALEHPGCIDLAALFRRPGLTLVRLGGAPAGAEAAERLIASLLMGLWTRAVLSREVIDGSLPVIGVFDEGQLAVRARDVEHFSRFATLARSKRGTLVFLNQQVSQLDHGFARVLRTNANLEMAFRSSAEDAAALASVLPLAVGEGAEAADRRELVRTLSHLPNRTFALWAKSLGHAALLRSPRIDLDGMRRDAGRIPESAAQALLAGTVPVRQFSAPPSPFRVPEEDAEAEAPGPDEGFPSLG